MLLITDSSPIPNLFTCKDLIVRENTTWFYGPDLKLWKKKLKLPVGSCYLEVRLTRKGIITNNNCEESRELCLESGHIKIAEREQFKVGEDRTKDAGI